MLAEVNRCRCAIISVLLISSSSMVMGASSDWIGVVILAVLVSKIYGSRSSRHALRAFFI